MRQPKHTIVHFNQLWARKAIPHDVRQALGKNQFLEKIGDWPCEYTQANALVSIKIAEWTSLIRQARNPAIFTRGPSKEVTTLSDKVVPARSTMVDLIMTNGILQDENQALRAARGDKKQNITSTFLGHFDEWKTRTHLKKKTLDQACSEIRKFSDEVPATLTSLTGRMVQTWIDDGLKTASAGTVRRKLSILKSYWGWLESYDYVARDQSPFDHRRVKDPRTSTEREMDSRQRFEDDDVRRLITASENDPPLNALIRIAVYSGARREGIASLRIAAVIIKDGIRCLSLKEKTAAGVRLVPIHSEISGLIDQLIKDSKDGFLIASLTAKHGDRGNALGRRFTPLKRSLGHGKAHVFHSFRHSVVHKFRSAGCPLEIRNQILGHEDGDETVGAGAGYGGDISVKSKLEWLERAIRY